jgi:vacuolar-type H+-ATPase subunit I/STV1
MSSRTMFLGRLIGLYCILIALAMIIRKDASMDVVTAMMHNAQLLLSLGAITVIAGLAIVLRHNIWSGGAVTVMVTLVGWIVLIKGSLLLFLSPEQESSIFLDSLHLQQGFYFYLGGTLLLGLYLTYAASRARAA